MLWLRDADRRVPLNLTMPSDINPGTKTMRCQRLLLTVSCVVLILGIPQPGYAGGGTQIVATKGHKTTVSPNWPAGVGDIVNATSRTKGWNSWFTEWPNDVNQYAFEVKSTADINGLIQKLASTKSELRRVNLSYMKEPNSLGWVTRVPEGNNIPVIFSIGDQSRIDDWFKRVRKPFGVMEFTATPVAVPPTLTIFVQNEIVNLDKLEIPAGVQVSNGYVPTVFHKSNTTLERDREEAITDQKKAEVAKQLKQALDESSKSALERIEEFLAAQDTDAE